MDKDYEKISFKKDKKKEVTEQKNSEITIKIKNSVLLFLVFILLSTDVFIDQILTKFEGAVEGNSTTTTGVIIQAIFLVIGYILIETITTSSII